MRISVREDDPGYHPMAFGAKVFVDGARIDWCFTADEEQGVAYCFAVDDEGMHVLDPNDPDEALTTEIRGHVKIVPPPTWERDTA